MRGRWVDVSLLVCLHLVLADAAINAFVRFVVKDLNLVTTGEPDDFMKDFMESLGCQVEVVDQQTINEGTNGQYCTGVDFIAVSSAVDGWSGISGRLKQCENPVIIFGGPHLYWHFGMIADDSSGSELTESLDIGPLCVSAPCTELSDGMSGTIQVFDGDYSVPVVPVATSFGNPVPRILSHMATNQDTHRADGFWDTTYGQTTIKNSVAAWKDSPSPNGLHSFRWQTDYILEGEFYNQYHKFEVISSYGNGWFRWTFSSNYDSFTGDWNWNTYSSPNSEAWTGKRWIAPWTVMFFYQKGDELADNSVAQGDRIATIPYYEEGHPMPQLSADGEKLLKANLRFAFPVVPHNVCNCPNGVARGTSTCPMDGATECSSCNPGYNGLTCQANICNCPNGVVRGTGACTTDGATECSSCNPGYNGLTCQANMCSCPNGVARIAPTCTIHSAIECSSCNSGHDGLTCQALNDPTTSSSTSSTTSSTASSTTSSTPTSSTATTTSQSSVSFKGEMVMTCSNAAELVEEPNIVDVIKDLLAKLYDILKSWIKDVIVTLKEPRRLSHLRRMDDSGEVDIQWKIDIPPSSDGQAVVKVYADKFDSKTLSEVTTTVNTFLNSGALEGQYTGDVKWVYVLPAEEVAEEVSSKSDEGSQLVVILSVIVGIASFILLVAVLFLTWRRTKRSSVSALGRRRKGTPLVDCSIDSLLMPPEKITAQDGDDLKTLCANIAATYEANLGKTTHKVCITYAHGKRDGDADGSGPGLYYAMAVAKVLNYHGVPCLFDMMILDTALDEARAVFTSQLTKRADCHVLIVVQTRTLYEDLDCLKDIYVAQQSKLKLLPLRFEEHLPGPAESWPQITREDLQGMLMVSEVQSNFSKLNSTPSPPYTVCNQPNALLETAHDLQRSLDITPSETKLKHQIAPESEVSGVSIQIENSDENFRQSEEDTLPFLSTSLQLGMEEEISQARNNKNKNQLEKGTKTASNIEGEERVSSRTRKPKSEDKDSGSCSRVGSDFSNRREHSREKKRSKDVPKSPESPHGELHSIPSSGAKKAKSDLVTSSRTQQKPKNLEGLRRVRSDSDSERSKRSDRTKSKSPSVTSAPSMSKSKHASTSLATASAPVSSMKPKSASSPGMV